MTEKQAEYGGTPREIDGVKVFTVEEVAEMMNLHVLTVRSYIKDGKLKAKKVGKRYWITEADLKSLFVNAEG
jgi:excisionase family DNA binding protein|tara:strand:- start:554 stop:769 length:216 start_codon:yes stop_codon:yes gene_type:complete